MDLVSVIIPYYKKKKFIKSTLQSVINQSYKKLEIIIIYDDEQTDELDHLLQFKKKDKRIKIIINKKNLGAGYSRNKGIKISKGKYIAFIDSDDLWFKDKLKYQINFMKRKSCEFSHTSYQQIDEKNKAIGFRIAKKYDNFQELLKSCDIGLSTVVLKKKLFKEKIYFTNLKTKEDFVLWLTLLKKGVKILSIKKKLVNWRMTKNSLSSNLYQKLIDGFRVYYIYMDFNFFKSIYYLFLLSINYLKKKN